MINTRTRIRPLMMALLVSALASACQPDDQTPGQWLSGEPQPYPEDWAFTNDHREVALEVGTPYLIPHSITVWCAELDGELYIAAARPDEKRWPGWVDSDPNVRIRVDGALIEARLQPLADSSQLQRVRTAQAEKYGLDPPSGTTSSRYWQVAPREG